MKLSNVAWRVALAFSILATPLLAQDTGTANSEALRKAHPKRPYSRTQEV